MSEKTRAVRYIGERAPRTFALPMPFVTASEQTGEVTFAQRLDVADVEAAQAKVMVDDFPMLFEWVSEKPVKRAKPNQDRSEDDSL